MWLLELAFNLQDDSTPVFSQKTKQPMKMFLLSNKASGHKEEGVVVDGRSSQ
jgi:hypothetical protein